MHLLVLRIPWLEGWGVVIVIAINAYVLYRIICAVRRR